MKSCRRILIFMILMSSKTVRRRNYWSYQFIRRCVISMGSRWLIRCLDIACRCRHWRVLRRRVLWMYSQVQSTHSVCLFNHKITKCLYPNYLFQFHRRFLHRFLVQESRQKSSGKLTRIFWTSYLTKLRLTEGLSPWWQEMQKWNLSPLKISWKFRSVSPTL